MTTKSTPQDGFRFVRNGAYIHLEDSDGLMVPGSMRKDNNRIQQLHVFRIVLGKERSFPVRVSANDKPQAGEVRVASIIEKF